MDNSISVNNDTYFKLKNEVINEDLCTHCGTCVGLSEGQLEMVDTSFGPLPRPKANSIELNPLAYFACPGKGVDYPTLTKSTFGCGDIDWRIGHYKEIYIGYSLNKNIRINGASGGIITNVLIHLLETNEINGAIVVKQGSPKPWLAEPVVACTKEEILSCSQSVYAPVPVNKILDLAKKHSGRLAYVGLPDQVASIRYIQSKDNYWLTKIPYIIGPYVGTNMYQESILSFIKSHGYKNYEDIQYLKYRDGEWPGYLKIITADGNILTAKKFYYNYLIPFYITRSSLYSVDFTNELTDISVGDAWSKKYENIGMGYSVIVARSKKGLDLLNTMVASNKINIESIPLKDAIGMHGHMIDFKKQGAFIRINLRKIVGKNSPNFGYRPASITPIRILIELVVSGIFILGRSRALRYLVSKVPVEIMGPLFNFTRLSWKRISKNNKRKGLVDYKVTINKAG